MNQNYSLMIHGGAGLVADKGSTLDSIKHVLVAGEKMLKAGASAVEAVEHCVSLLEDDPAFNAGHGAVLNHQGQIDLDAGIMNGLDMTAGAIAGVQGVKNPIKLARQVMENSEHVFLIGGGAQEFAKKQKLEFAEQDYFVTEQRVKQLEEARASGQVVLDHSSLNSVEKKFGTVGAVARDRHGNLAAATSTGGIVNKRYGRVGDTPVVGAGVYAENATCAVSATGYGEQFIRTVISKHIAEIVRYKKVDAQTAAEQGIKYLVDSVKGLGGVIVIDSQGNCGKAYSTPGMIYGYAREGQLANAALE